MKNIVYTLTYEYYQYNSGAADNGHYKKNVSFNSLEKAVATVNQMNKSIEKRKLSEKQYREDDYSLDLETILTDDIDEDLKSNYIPYMGYFIEVQLKKSERTETLLNDKGQEVDSDGHLLTCYPPQTFADCPHCYDAENGPDNNCSHCKGSGNRKFTPENFQLAEGASEWLKEQMDNVWSDYNAVYELKRYLIKWYFESDNRISIQAGYSCRGYETVDYYEMPVAWLYAENRKQLIQAQYDKEQEEKMLKDNQRKVNELEALKQRTRELEAQLNKGE